MPEAPLKRILVIDDDPLIAKSLGSVLEMDGYAVTIAGDGRAGIDAFEAALKENSPFILVITDLGMHGVDGRQVVSAVKTSSPATPVILLTGWGQWFENNQDEAPLQVNCILAKPPSLVDLRRALAQCLV
jgi:CheY-like chemotaxis protein